MRISVIIPCFNAVEWVGAAVASALSQTHPDVEIIVVDDGSTDGSAEAAAACAPRVRVERTPHAGACHARNVGVGLATGEGVVFLDADDLLAPDTLAAMANTRSALPPGARIAIACPWRDLVADPAVPGAWIPMPAPVPAHPPGGDPVAGWLTGWYLPSGSVLWPREVIVGLGGWDEALTVNQDGDLATRAFLSGVELRWARGGEFLYRQFAGARTTVSAVVSAENVRCRMRVLEKIATTLEASGRLSQYEAPLGRAYEHLARVAYMRYPDLEAACSARAHTLAGWRVMPGRIMYRVACRVLGLEGKRRLVTRLAAWGLARGGHRRPKN